MINIGLSRSTEVFPAVGPSEFVQAVQRPVVNACEAVLDESIRGDHQFFPSAGHHILNAKRMTGNGGITTAAALRWLSNSGHPGRLASTPGSVIVARCHRRTVTASNATAELRLDCPHSDGDRQ